MKKGTGLILTAIVAMALWFQPAAHAGDGVAIIANKNMPENSISIGDISTIFLAVKTQWNSGQPIQVATLNGGPTHENFLKQYLKKTPSQFKRYFRSLIFTGTGRPLRSVGSDADMVAFVSATEGAIGYVSSGTNVGSAKVLTVK